ncbi:hypothetical protein PLEOSDRAFT_159399 [Pleurotus ostreatus PC15]|uniref:Uncharacterized protein n=1 Tax=Pleurotus ostreatus (strain PC15) TaxID=1137138 RepID=A0A067NRG0_PLEO1|nr:hypothetical protein PLEOSDRAFT_159399 [Pleurotus ostreatus PC15]
MPPIRRTPRADRASRRLSFMPVAPHAIKRPTYLSILMYVCFATWGGTVPLKVEDIYDQVARAAEEAGVEMGVRAALMLRKAVLLLENGGYIEIDEQSADGRIIIPTEDMVTIMTQTREQISQHEFSSYQVEFLTICSLFTQRLRKKSPTMLQVEALEKRIKELQQQLRDAVSHAEEEPIGQDGHPDLEFIDPAPIDPCPPATPVRRTASMIQYPTPESLPRIRRSASTHNAGSSSSHPLSRDNNSAMNIEEEAQVHADLVLQLQSELTDSQDRNRAALARIEELNQEIQQLNNNKAAMELDTDERQQQFALWRIRINQELCDSQETSENLRVQNKLLHHQVEELSSDVVTSKTQINKLQEEVSEFKTFWQSYSRIEAEARERLFNLRLPTFLQ